MGSQTSESSLSVAFSESLWRRAARGPAHSGFSNSLVALGAHSPQQPQLSLRLGGAEAKACSRPGSFWRPRWVLRSLGSPWWPQVVQVATRKMSWLSAEPGSRQCQPSVASHLLPAPLSPHSRVPLYQLVVTRNVMYKFPSWCYMVRVTKCERLLPGMINALEKHFPPSLYCEKMHVT